ncbi:MAG TPA: citrate synthase/methylcitrate synthase [Candidatus Limnocylindria bacterium]|nr:citrate synthase/methylcitrate synthase [Candidatus Limnocylindria bacterium]
MASVYVPGLQGIVAARTRLSKVDGRKGELVIAGYPLEEIAGRATFEEMVFLLWNDRLPNGRELGAFRAELAALRDLPAITRDVLDAAAAQKLPAMDALRMAAGTLSLRADGETVPDGPYRDALVCVARFATIVASYGRLLAGEGPIAPHHGLSHAANYLYMLKGARPSEARARALETYLNTVIDHGLNASTFTARVIVSTESDVISAIVGAIGALKGPLHGGAPGPALDMVFEIRQAANAEPFMRVKLERGERLMGFGHRVYKVRDPRADVLSRAAEELFRADGDVQLYELAREVERVALRLLDEYKPGRNLRTNVEFFTALVLHGLGIPVDLFTPTFAVSRVAGWAAHCLEQLSANRIIRPESEYTGDTTRQWVPPDGR